MPKRAATGPTKVVSAEHSDNDTKPADREDFHSPLPEATLENGITFAAPRAEAPVIANDMAGHPEIINPGSLGVVRQQLDDLEELLLNAMNLQPRAAGVLNDAANRCSALRKTLGL